MDHVAIRTDMPGHIVQRRDTDCQGMAAMRTEFHGNRVGIG